MTSSIASALASGRQYAKLTPNTILTSFPFPWIEWCTAAPVPVWLPNGEVVLRDRGAEQGDLEGNLKTLARLGDLARAQLATGIGAGATASPANDGDAGTPPLADFAPTGPLAPPAPEAAATTPAPVPIVDKWCIHDGLVFLSPTFVDPFMRLLTPSSPPSARPARLRMGV